MADHLGRIRFGLGRPGRGRSRGVWRPWYCVILFALVYFLSLAGPVRAQDQGASGLEMAGAIQDSLVRTIAECEASVVAVWRVKRNSRGSSPPPPPPGVEFIPLRYGAGVVVDKNGLILVPSHLLDEKDVHWVTTSDRRTYVAKIKASDPRSALAILEIESEDLTPITFGEAERLKKGQIVITLGNPQAIARDGQVSASWGIVSNLGRKAGPLLSESTDSIDRVKWQRPTLHHFGTLIQTDTRLHFNSSGGALVNLRGELVGLTTTLASLPGQEAGASYAIPINSQMRRIIERLKEGREVEYGVVGFSVVPLPVDQENPNQRGVLIGRVFKGTPADRSGFREGDIVTHIEGQAVEDPDQMILRLGSFPVDSRIRVRYLRGEERKTADVVMAKLAVPGHKIVTQQVPPWRGMRVDYSTATPNMASLSGRGLLDGEGCVVIASVAEDSPAWKVGLRPDMFVSHVDGRRVARPSDFRREVAANSGPVRLRLTSSSKKRPEKVIQPES